MTKKLPSQKESNLPEKLTGEQFARVCRMLWQEVGFLEDQRQHKHPVALRYLNKVRMCADEFRRTKETKYALAALKVRG